MRAIPCGAFVLAACAGNARTSPDGGGAGGGGGGSGSGDTAADVAQDYDDVASSLAVIARAPELAAMDDSVVLSYGGMPDGLTASGAGIASGSRDALMFEYKYHCHDATDALIPCGPSVDHGHTYPTIRGGIAAGDITISNLEHTSDWTIKNLQAQTPTIDRAGKLSFSSSVASDGATLDVTSDGTWTKVHLQPTPTMPSDGTITLAISVMRNRAAAAVPARSFTVNATVTFASGGATIALDGSHQYAVNLSTGAVTKL